VKKSRSKSAPVRKQKKKTSAKLAAPLAVPVWDGARRELRLGKTMLKCFRRPAKNQENILAAFQEEGWTAHIDDPLTNGDNVEAVERLHNAIKRLNQQKVRKIRFLSDGLGRGILWEHIEPGSD
jgi:hypothetical protein